MKKILIAILLLTSGLYALQCDYPNKYCLKMTKEPMYERVYIINMTPKHLIIKNIELHANGQTIKRENKIYKPYSKTILIEKRRGDRRYKFGWEGADIELLNY